MKIKAIAAICKKNKRAVLFNRRDADGDVSAQLIGDGVALYPISGLPELDRESVFTIFDVPEKERDTWAVQYSEVSDAINLEDADATEKIIEQGEISIVCAGKVLKPLQTSRGLVFIESRYLAPISDILDAVELYERRTADGAPYIVAKAGLILQAAIMPQDVITALFVKQLHEIATECSRTLEFAELQKQARQTGGAAQFSINPATGEVEGIDAELEA